MRRSFPSPPASPRWPLQQPPASALIGRAGFSSSDVLPKRIFYEQTWRISALISWWPFGLSLMSTTASWAATDTAPPIGRGGGKSKAGRYSRDRRFSSETVSCGRPLHKSVVRYSLRPTRLRRCCPIACRLRRPWPPARLRLLGMNLSQHDLDCWLDCGAVHRGLLLCTTTHAPHGPEVERILSNFMALLAGRRACCDRGFHRGSRARHSSKNEPQTPIIRGR
jgi:hypothetical protein